MLKLVCISDTHLLHDQIKLPDGDVLIHAGDMTNFGSKKELQKVAEWLRLKSYKYKIVICGNHEKEVSEKTNFVKTIFEPYNIKVLHNETLNIDGIKFYGEPRTPEFCNWGWAYNPGYAAENVWNMLPEDTDVLICHGPPFGYADFVPRSEKRAGCPSQLEKLKEVRPQFVICGHIHEGYGIYSTDFETTIVNAAICTEHYKPTNNPIVIDVHPRVRK